jgi:hypothetical protein
MDGSLGSFGLIQIVDAALAEAVRKSGDWLACRPGCCECCMGPFPITEDDAARLRHGLRELESRDPEGAARIRSRARRWSESDDEPCPVLDPDTGTCDLYAARPLTCRPPGAVRLRRPGDLRVVLRWGDRRGDCGLRGGSGSRFYGAGRRRDDRGGGAGGVGLRGADSQSAASTLVKTIW